MAFDPNDIQNVVFSDTHNKAARDLSGSLAEGFIQSMIGHVIVVVVTFMYGIFFLPFVQWIYLTPMFFWMRRQGRTETLQGIFLGAMAGGVISVSAFFIGMLFSDWH